MRVLALVLVAFLGCTEKAAPPPPAAKKGMAGLTGKWTVKLSDKQEKELKNMGLIFAAEEPDPAVLATLSPQEAQAIGAMREARKRTPNDPQFLQMQAVILGMASSRLNITTSSMSLAIGQVRQEADLSIVTETSTSVTLKATIANGKAETVQFLIDGPDAIRLAKPGQKDALMFVRVPGSGK